MSENLRSLDPEELARLGSYCADLLTDAADWTRRRKEAATILDESSIRRQQSVDFSFDEMKLDPQLQKLLERVFGPKICAVPLFILEKTPANSLAFDLQDESGRSLPLMTSGENAALTSATLKALCEGKLGRPLSDKLAEKIDHLACGSASEGLRWLERLQEPLPDDPDRAEVAALLDPGDGGELERWLTTFAGASIVLVIFEATGGRRRIIKLSYDQQMDASERLRTRLGWTSFSTWLVSPFVDSERYHFEVKAPLGLRLTKAILSDDTDRPPAEDDGFRRSAHLYIEDARCSGGAVAGLRLRVSGFGVLGASLAAALLVLVAELACIRYSKNIAASSGSAPALLLVLPGIIATYAARVDQHGLITRLLALPRWILLLCSGFSAYYAAGRIALAGPAKGDAAIEAQAGAIESWLWPAVAVAAVAVIVLGIGWIFTREVTHRWIASFKRVWRGFGRNRFRLREPLPMSPDTAWNYVIGDATPSLLPEQRIKQATSWKGDGKQLLAGRYTKWLKWTHAITVEPGPAGTHLRWFFRLNASLPRPFPALLVYRERRISKKRIEALIASVGPGKTEADRETPAETTA